MREGQGYEISHHLSHSISRSLLETERKREETLHLKKVRVCQASQIHRTGQDKKKKEDVIPDIREDTHRKDHHP